MSSSLNAQYDSISQLPLGVSKFSVLDHNQGLATYFREYLRQQMKDWCKTHFKADGILIISIKTG